MPPVIGGAVICRRLSAAFAGFASVLALYAGSDGTRLRVLTCRRAALRHTAPRVTLHTVRLDLGHAPDLHGLRFPSRRSAVLGRRGMVATSQPLAAMAALRILDRGGNAFDAAVAASAALTVVEPTGTSLGGDAFALIFRPGHPVEALNGSGRAPQALAAAELRASHTEMPVRGGLSVTVPGCVAAWSDLSRRHGALTLAEALAPAIELAEDGFPVSELIASSWRASAPLLAAYPDATRHYLIKGRAPLPGEIVRFSALAGTLREVASGGAAAFYTGPIAAAIARTVQQAGGALTEADLASHKSDWVTPLSVRYGPWRVWECPPNGQGLAALVALGIAHRLRQVSLEWDDPLRLHRLIGAMRIGMAAAQASVGDACDSSIDHLLTDTYFTTCAHEIDRQPVVSTAIEGPERGDTVYLAVVDGAGNACSFIASNYMGFGSGLVAGDTGVSLQNRAAGFVLTEGHPNEFGPGKRPFHTIMPGLATRDEGDLAACFGVMGGSMQPQGHLQFVANCVDLQMDPQRALDCPRFRIMEDGRLALEPSYGLAVRSELSQLGERLVPVSSTPGAGMFGGGQAILVSPEGVRIGGSDPRKDGLCVGQL